MKILMPILHYPPVIGGLEQWSQNIAERLSDKMEFFIVTGKVKNCPKKEIKNKIKIIRTSLFSLKNLSYSGPLYLFSTLPFVFLKSLNLLRKEKIDLLHCQGFLSSLLGFLLFKITKIPYIVTVQRLEKKGIIRKLVYKNAKVCIGASSAIGRYFKEIGCKNIEIIPNGIDLKMFIAQFSRLETRKRLGIEDKFLILTVARLEKVKGIEYLIKAAHILNFQYTTFNFQLMIIGDGSERRNLERLVEKLRLKDRVKFLGQIENKKIPQYLASTDCFVLPSIKEGFGIAILEAQAAGVPVIASKVGGIVDIIEDGKTGILVQPKNPMAIAEAVLRIYYHRDFAKKLVENAKKSVIKYDWQNIARKVERIYQNLL